MAMAAKSFGRRPHEQTVAEKPAASLGAVLELMRALNWFIRADVPWPTKRGQAFDFVLAGESGVFALWVHEGEPIGVEDATVELGRLLGDVQVRPVVCRGALSLASADSSILFCTPDTALDLLVGLPAFADQAAIPAIVNRLRELVVPLPPEAVPAPQPDPLPAPVVPAPPKIEPQPSVPQAVPKPAPVEPSVPRVEPSVPRVEPSALRVEPSAPSPGPEEVPKPERTPGGRHRSEKPKRVLATRRTPPAPPAASGPKSSIELPTAIAPPRPRTKGGNGAAQRFDNNYVYVAPPSEKPSALKKEFRAKPFIFGIVGLVALALIVGVGIKEWPKIASLAHSTSNPSTTFGGSIAVSATNFHPALTLTITQPTPASVSRGMVSYAVTLTAVNTGGATWQLPARSSLTMIDSIGESSAVADIRGGRWGGSLKAHQRWVRTLIFKIRSGRSPVRVQFALAAADGETPTWK